MKTRYIVLILVLCVILALGALFGPKIYGGIRVCQLTEDFLTGESRSLDVRVMTEGNRNVDVRLDWQSVGQKRIFTLESGGESIYYCDGVIYLKNGKGYRFSEALPDLSPILEKPWLLAPLVQIQKEGDQWLLALKTEELLPQIRNLNVTLEEGEEGIRKVYVNTWGKEVGDFLGLQAVVRQERTVAAVPEEVIRSIKSGAVQGGKDLTKDIIRMIKGWMILNNKDPLGVEMDVSVDLLELPLSTQLTLYTTGAYGKPISYLSKNGTGFYFTEGAACTAEGVAIDTPDSSMDMSRLFGLAYYLCFNGELSCDGDIYRLALNQQGMEQVLYTIVPEAKDMALSLTEGTLELRMEGDAISSIYIHVAGQVDLVITKVDIGAGVDMKIIQEEFELNIPQKVLDTLLE